MAGSPRYSNFPLVLFLALFSSVMAFSDTPKTGYPQHANDYVNDFAGILSSPERKAVEARFKRLEYQTGIEAVVVTIDAISDFETSDPNIESFATHLFNDWGVGHKQSNNGVLFLIAAKDRKVRIELGGAYGHRFDSRMNTILEDTVLPKFKAGEMNQGILLGSEEIEKQITIPVTWLEFYRWHLFAGGVAVCLVLSGIFFEARGKQGLVWLCFGGALFLIFGILMALIAGKSESGFGGGSSGGGGATGGW